MPHYGCRAVRPSLEPCCTADTSAVPSRVLGQIVLKQRGLRSRLPQPDAYANSSSVITWGFPARTSLMAQPFSLKAHAPFLSRSAPG